MRRASDQDSRRVFTRRALLLGAGQLALVGGLAGRLYYLQVVEAERYRALSRDNRFDLELTPPARGRIFDRNGLALAGNRDNFRVEIVPEQAGDPARVLATLRRLVEVEDAEVERVLRAARRRRGFLPIAVVENLSRADISRVAVNAPYLPGVRIEIGHSREYPFAASAVHVTGYVAPVSPSELTGDPALELPDFRIGKSGIEKRYDLEMRGVCGRRRVEVNAVGRVVRALPGDEGRPGRDIALTVDARLQAMASARLALGAAELVPRNDPRARAAQRAARRAGMDIGPEDGDVALDAEGALATPESGAAVVMDIHRGDILALASTPGFDPNAFNRGLSPGDWERVLSNPRSPMINKAVSGQYPPGSTFKMLVCLAALEAGIATPETEVTCEGHVELGRQRFHCWARHGHGAIDMLGAIERSCDVYHYEMARRVGIERIAAMARRFGLGAPLGVDLPGERPGLVPTPDWKLAARGEPWRTGETLIAGIGQGFLLCTPLQLAAMTARLANRGRAAVPRLLRDPAAPEPVFEGMGLASGHLDAVLEGMVRVVEGPRGTARAIRDQDGGLRIAGKTGSVQVRRITRAERRAGKVRNEDRPWRHRDHALFVGVAPAEAPRHAIAVVVEHGGSGGRVAAPIARDILVEAARLDAAGVAPAGPPPPSGARS